MYGASAIAEQPNSSRTITYVGRCYFLIIHKDMPSANTKLTIMTNMRSLTMPSIPFAKAEMEIFG